MDISIPLFQKVPPEGCPRHNGKMGVHGGTLQPGRWGHWASIQAALQPQKTLGGVRLQTERRKKCYSRPVRRLAQLPGAA